MSHLSHLKHIRQLEMIGAKGLQVEKVELEASVEGWTGPTTHQYDWFFYLVDGKFVLNHPYSSAFAQVQEELLATKSLDEHTAKDLLNRIECIARVCARLDDMNRSNQRLFIKHVDSAVIVNIDFTVREGVRSEELPEQVLVTCEWLHEGSLFWVTNMPYAIFPTKQTFNALKLNEDTPAGHWHVKLYIRDECFASLSFRLEENSLFSH